jgi:two-component system response regulator GlrR
MTLENIIPEDLILETKARSSDLKTLRKAREEFEREYLTNLMKLTEGNVTRASELAGRYGLIFITC